MFPCVAKEKEQWLNQSPQVLHEPGLGHFDGVAAGKDGGGLGEVDRSVVRYSSLCRHGNGLAGRVATKNGVAEGVEWGSIFPLTENLQ